MYQDIFNNNGNAYSGSKFLNKAIYNYKESIHNNGGIIILPIDNNLNYESFYTYISNKFFNVSKYLAGWTFGKFLHGNYTSQNGKVFNENSLSVEIIGLADEVLISIAEQICTEMNQECILVKSYFSNRILIVDSK